MLPSRALTALTGCLLVAALVAAGCGSSDSSDDSSPKGSSAAAPSDAPDDGSDTLLRTAMQSFARTQNPEPRIEVNEDGTSGRILFDEGEVDPSKCMMVMPAAKIAMQDIEFSLVTVFPDGEVDCVAQDRDR